MDILNLKKGDEIAFGAYPQNADGDELSPIEWIVLEHTEKELFLLSKKVLVPKEYASTDSSWADSNIRRWLNADFYEVAFSADEKLQIFLTHCIGNGLCGENDKLETDDKVFLLSDTEAAEIEDGMKQAFATEYAKAKGVFTNPFSGEASWWLRNRVEGFSEAYCSNGETCVADGFWVSALRCGLRMAIKVAV